MHIIWCNNNNKILNIFCLYCFSFYNKQKGEKIIHTRILYRLFKKIYNEFEVLKFIFYGY